METPWRCDKIYGREEERELLEERLKSGDGLLIRHGRGASTSDASVQLHLTHSVLRMAFKKEMDGFPALSIWHVYLCGEVCVSYVQLLIL